MPTEIIRFSVEPTRLDGLVAVLDEYGASYYSNGGADAVTFLQDADDRSWFFAVIEWSSRDDATAAGDSEEGRRFFGALRPLIEGAPQISHGDVIWQLTR